MDQKIKTGLGVAVIVFVAFMFGALFMRTPVAPNQPIECTREAKQCPDGSYISRTGPNCEFATCPNAQIVGGQCEYQPVPGSCRISTIAPDGTVKFIYSANGTLSPDDIPLEKNLNGEHSDTLNILNPDNNPVKAGDTIYCEAQIITQGTCTPVIFRFVTPPIFNSAK